MEPVLTAVVTLSVQEPISNVTLRANATDLVELNDTAIFTCSVSSGTSLSYRWMNGSSEVAASDRVQLGVGNSTLSIVSVTRYDEGPFRCEVINGISNGTSQPIGLNVRYGPSKLTMMVVPEMIIGHTAYMMGSVITLSCSAQSKPAVSYKWRFNGVFLNEQSPQLSLQNTRENQTGSYTCLAHNNVTLRYATITTMIKIVEPISAVSLNRDGKPPILDQSFTLRCEVTGPVDYIHWLINGQVISLNNRTFFSTDNKTMVINPIQFSDSGEYLCEAFNAVSNKTSMTYKLVVNYGPEKPDVTSPDIAMTGHIVTFNCSASSQPPSQFSWFFNGSQVETGSVYETGPLTLASHGEYTCMAFNNVTGRNSTASKMLTIIAPVTMTTVKVIGAQPILNERFSLTCETAGTVYSIQWMRNGWPLYADNRTDFSMNNTLTFNYVQDSDIGYYQCSASNPLSNMTSSNYRLIVNYGPEMPVITGPALGETGHNLTFNCSASSQPPSQFSWFFNGSQVVTGSVYETDPLTLASHGEYTCVAFNNVTGRNSTVSKMLIVIEPVSMAMVKVMGAQPIADNMFTLTCETTGTIYSIHWMKNGWPLYADNRTDFSMNNNTLTFNSVQDSDNGGYQCSAYNPLSNMTSTEYRLIVNYGPERPVIMSPDIAMTGYIVTFNCSASSQPPSQFSWFFNGSQVETGSVYETDPLTLASHGEYTCVAFNNITDRNSTASKMLTIIAPVTMTTVKVIGAQPILNERFSLTCGTAGTVYSIQWMRNGWPLYADNRTDFSMNNNTLTLNYVQDSDIGDYQCSASNPLSNMTSSNYRLIVNYGPEAPVITGPALGETGHNLTFNCSASSQPPSQFSWFFNGSQVVTGSVYETDPLTLASHGEYTCVAFNNVTGRNSTVSKMLIVIEPVSMAMVKVMGAQPIADNMFTLTCETTGTIYSIHWMKNGWPLYADNRTDFSMNNNTLNFNSVQDSDNGGYQCSAYNPLSNMTSTEYRLIVNYGPERPVIMSPDIAMTGYIVTFNCSASSQPPSQFSWFFNGSQVETGSVYETDPLTLASHGEYTCVAFNNITDRNSTASKMLTIIDTAQVLLNLQNNEMEVEK
ncbi:hemicentin-1-like [Oncorhynchus clarkii lewisi]|uniref:hemicentin-1-like n=1 Tax=Oncorhynchus clarkii lewisi TaxID=490388 RepID=UPI0039B826AB